MKLYTLLLTIVLVVNSLNGMENTTELNEQLLNACESGDVKLVQELVEKGADFNAECANSIMKTPFLMACSKGHLNIVRFLVEKGADPNARTRDWNNTALLYACENGHLETVRFLIDKGAFVGAFNQYGWYDTPLQRACENGHADIVKLLIAEGANINDRDRWGMTPLHFACKNGHLDVAQLLINKHAKTIARTDSFTPDINMSDASPLYLACKRGHLNIVQLFIDKGINKLILPNHVFLSSMSERKKIISIDDVIHIIKIYKEPTAIFNALKWSFENNKKEYAQALCAGNSPVLKEAVNHRGKNGNRLLHDIPTSEPKTLRNAKARLLLEAGADPNIENNHGLTPLHIAVKQNDRPLMALLIKHGANTESLFYCVSAAANRPQWLHTLLELAYAKRSTWQKVKDTARSYTTRLKNTESSCALM